MTPRFIRSSIAIAASTYMLLALGIFSVTGAVHAASVPDGSLLAKQQNLPRWWYVSKPSPKAVALYERAPSEAEQSVVDKANAMLASGELRAFAMLEGDKVVHSGFSGPANPDSLFYGYSMGKTITGMATGQAICAGKMELTSKAGDVIPELAGTDLGESTVHDLLRMASGTRMNNNHPSLILPSQESELILKKSSFFDLMMDSAVTSAHKSVFGNKRKPGDAFEYKGTEPMTLGVMIAKATSMPFSQWMQEQVYDPMGAAKTGNFLEDPQRIGMTSGGSRLRFEDWLRFAVWVKKSSKAPGCLGDFVRASMTKQIKNDPLKQRRAGYYYDSYGYLMWTENTIAPNTAWAVGLGGQLIGWNLSSDRIIVAFSNDDSSSAKVYAMSKEWNAIK
ncbi:serine hydrolase domain-containing protein [Rhodoferax saidenbachensis]|uniref:Beta-lactamase-related domain-containing protein n=1 Tax=Rhodoferax saidenbachensis TaxID=1484693 RepID=A0A1P8K7P4_9BURK|nr:serine hydrolase [Rhodoferax saidenbachensis]APW42014.1 hypothetical protein RS694_05320 [Rhodoferax saidenbachensis]